MADSAQHSGLDAEQLGGFSQEQLNGYLMRAGILMDVADFGAMPVYTGSFVPPENLENAGRTLASPVNITLDKNGYCLEIATAVIPWDPNCFIDKKVLNGYAPPANSQGYLANTLDENTLFMQGRMAGKSAFEKLLESKASAAAEKAVSKALGSGLAVLGLSGPQAAVCLAAYSTGKSILSGLVKDAETTKEYEAMVNANNQMRVYDKLGYELQYSVLDNNQLVVRYTPAQSPCDDHINQAAFNSYLQEQGLTGNYTVEQITEVMLHGHQVTNATEGSVTTWVAQPMDAEQLRELGITAEQQQEIVENMQHCDMGKARERLEEKLVRSLTDNPNVFNGKTNLDALTEEEVQKLSEMI